MSPVKHEVHHSTVVTTTVVHTIKLTAADIRELLSRREAVPKDADVTVTIPSWECHGETLSLDECDGVVIAWTETIKEK